jgi:hypothetical protein
MANRFWRGGSGTWNTSSTTNWSATDGGAGGASAPTTADDVFITSLSGSPTVTITIANCKSLTTTGATCTLTGTGASLTVAGSITLSSTTSCTVSGGTLSVTGTGTITTNGVSFTFLNINLTPGAGNTITFGSAFTQSTVGGTTTIGVGTYNLNGQTVSAPIISAGSTTVRTIQFNAGNLSIIGSGSTSSFNGTNLSYTGTPTINVSGTNKTITATTGFTEANVLSFNVTAPSGTFAITTNSFLKSLNFTGFAGTWAPATASTTFYGNVTLVSGMTYTTATTGIWTFANTSGVAILTSAGKTVGPITLNGSGGTLRLGDTFSQTTTRAFTYTAGTIDINSQTNTFGVLTITSMPTIITGPLNATTVTQSSGTVTVPASATAQFTATGLYTLTSGTLALGTNNATLSVGSVAIGSNTVTFGTSGQLTLTGNATTVYTATTPTFTGTTKIVSSYSGGTGTRTFTMGTMTEANSIDVSAGSVTGLSFGTAGTDVVSIAGNLKSLDLTGFTGTFANQTRTLYGNLTAPSTGGTYSAGSNVTTFAATSGTQTITSNGRLLDFSLTQSGVDGTVALSGALTLGGTRTYTLTNGTLNLNNNTLSTGLFASNSSSTRVIQFGTGNITCTGTASTTLNFNGGNGTFTYTGTPTVNISNNSASTTTLSVAFFLATNAFDINVTTGTYSFSPNDGAVFKSLNFTGFAGTWASGTSSYTFYGSLTLVSGMTYTTPTGGVYTFANTSGTATLTSAGNTLYAITLNYGTLQLPASTTTTVSSFVAKSTALKYLTSSIPGTQATISQASGTVNAVNLSITDSNATGGATWNAYASTNGGNNTGWNFISSQLKTVFITSGSTYTIPSDFSFLNSVEAIGGGGGGFTNSTRSGGSGGGAYSASDQVTGLTANGTVYINVGSGGTGGASAIAGGDTWFNAASNAAPTLTTQGVLAKGGSAANSRIGANGGSSVSGVGTIRNSGGSGGAGNSAGGGSGGGGGAAGPGGNGGGTTTTNPNTDGGQGGSSGATLTSPGTNGIVGGAAAGGNGGASSGQVGGSGATAAAAANATSPTNGGGGGGGFATTNINAGAGSAGTYWTATAGGTAGSGGGGGGAAGITNATGGNGGLYGGGAGGSTASSAGASGGQGIVVFTYISIIPANSNFFLMF